MMDSVLDYIALVYTEQGRWKEAEELELVAVQKKQRTARR
jgi:hypothetical protein